MYISSALGKEVGMRARNLPYSKIANVIVSARDVKLLSSFRLIFHIYISDNLKKLTEG